MSASDEILTRGFRDLDLELRAEGPDKRTIVGIVVPYDQPTFVRDKHGEYDEVFHRGAFADATRDPGKVMLLRNHSWDQIAGRARLLRDDAVGLYGEFPVSATSVGNDLLTEVIDGLTRGFSVGFRPKESIGTAGYDALVERVRAKLVEVSAITGPRQAYAGAQIAGVTRDGDIDDDETVIARTLAERRALAMHPRLRRTR